MKTILALTLAASPLVLAEGIACIQAITTTMAYEPALQPHGTECPSDPGSGISYYLANNGAGCCSSTAQVKSVGTKGAACCPCGAMCTGFMPEMYAWSTGTNGITSAPVPTATGSGTRPSSNSADATTMVEPTTSLPSATMTTSSPTGSTTTPMTTGAGATTSPAAGSSGGKSLDVRLYYFVLSLGAVVISVM